MSTSVTPIAPVNDEIMVQFLEAIRFEHWIRFHCLHAKTEAGQEDQAMIFIPDFVIQQCQIEVPHLTLLLCGLQNSDVTLDSTRHHLFSFMKAHLEKNDEEFQAIIEELTTHQGFQRYLDAFYGFVQMEGDAEEAEIEDMQKRMSEEEFIKAMEDAPIPSFSTWTEKFYRWVQSQGMDVPFTIKYSK